MGSTAHPDDVTFSTFVLGLASTALIHLGEARNPETGSETVDLVLARQTLGLLGMLHEKTTGNLTADEERLLAQLLTDLRVRFVKKSGP